MSDDAYKTGLKLIAKKAALGLLLLVIAVFGVRTLMAKFLVPVPQDIETILAESAPGPAPVVLEPLQVIAPAPKPAKAKPITASPPRRVRSAPAPPKARPIVEPTGG